MCWRMIYDGVMDETDAEQFKKTNEWFVTNLPIPEICKMGDQAVITFFKVQTTSHMIEQIEPVMKLLISIVIPMM